MEKTPEISVVIPIFNASPCLEQLVSEISYVLKNAGKEFEIICVDDGSKDNSWETVKALSANYENVRGFRLGKNFGQHKATLCGINESRGEWIVTVDDDFEHLPEDILKLIAKARDGAFDLFYAVPVNRRKGWCREIASAYYKRISRIENADAGKGSSFRVISRFTAEQMHGHNTHLFFLDEILLWHTDKVGTMDIKFGKSCKKASGYTYPKLFSLSKNVFMISTTLPLKLMQLVGFTMAAFSFLFGLYHVIHKLFFPTAKGFTSIILSILFSAGLILICLGVIAEYLGNILIAQNKKPGYSVRDKV